MEVWLPIEEAAGEVESDWVLALAHVHHFHWVVGHRLGSHSVRARSVTVVHFFHDSAALSQIGVLYSGHFGVMGVSGLVQIGTDLPCKLLSAKLDLSSLEFECLYILVHDALIISALVWPALWRAVIGLCAVAKENGFVGNLSWQVLPVLNQTFLERI